MQPTGMVFLDDEGELRAMASGAAHRLGRRIRVPLAAIFVQRFVGHVSIIAATAPTMAAVIEDLSSPLPSSDAAEGAAFEERDRLARWFFAATALVVAAGIVIQLPVTATTRAGHFADATARTFNVFTFFTIDSNLLLGVTCGLLAIRLERSSALFRVLRLAGVVGMTITGVVFHVALASILELDGWAQAANQLQHTVAPLLAVAGWLLYGPRGQTSRRYALYALAYPIAWMAFTLIRGAAIHWYPYPFIDVDVIGYGRAGVNAVWVAALFLAVTAAAVGLDGFLVRTASWRVGAP